MNGFKFDFSKNFPSPDPSPVFSRASPSILRRFASSTRASIRASPSTFSWRTWFGPQTKFLDPHLSIPRHDDTSCRHKSCLTYLSLYNHVLERWLFSFYCILSCKVQRYCRFYIRIWTSRLDVPSWHQKSCFTYLNLYKFVIDIWFLFVSIWFRVAEFRNVIIYYVFAW